MRGTQAPFYGEVHGMNIFDIIGPVMVGPSSSHTAGAARIGMVARKLLGEEPVKAEILLHGSFLATGSGHGTDRALVAGLLGFEVDDSRIPQSFAIARERGLDFAFGAADLGEEAHPNSAELHLTGESGKELTVVGASVGGGRIRIVSLDGQEANFSGESPALIVHHTDRPGRVAEVSTMLEMSHVNVAAMQLYRTSRGGHAVMVLECDEEIPQEVVRRLGEQDGMEKVIYYSPA